MSEQQERTHPVNRPDEPSPLSTSPYHAFRRKEETSPIRRPIVLHSNCPRKRGHFISCPIASCVPK